MRAPLYCLRTTGCRRYSHPEFQIAYDPSVVVVEKDVESIIRWLEESIAEGVKYADGQTCQVGWAITEVRAHASGDLTLWEPDMESMPIRWVEGLTSTLTHLRVQKDTVESVLGRDDLSFPSLLQSGVICTRLGRFKRTVMDRQPPNGGIQAGFLDAMVKTTITMTHRNCSAYLYMRPPCGMRRRLFHTWLCLLECWSASKKTARSYIAATANGLISKREAI